MGSDLRLGKIFTLREGQETLREAYYFWAWLPRTWLIAVCILKPAGQLRAKLLCKRFSFFFSTKGAPDKKNPPEQVLVPTPQVNFF